jgi:predicted nucleic acid-binding OB-fold protein
MDEYCNYKDAFHNDNVELDKMALSINNKRKKNNDKERLQYLLNNSSQDGTFSPSQDDVSDLSSTYSDLSPALKKNLRLTTKHLQSNDENKIIKHIQSCDECKNELIKIMNVKHIKKKNKPKILQDDKPYELSNDIIISNDDVKNLIIVIIIGLITIIIINKL